MPVFRACHGKIRKKGDSLDRLRGVQIMNDKLKACIDQVRKPARYVGGEYNSVIKDKSAVDVRIALCFPELYEIGMSHLGSKILYGLFNSMEGVWAERAYAPYTDMENEMRKRRSSRK